MQQEEDLKQNPKYRHSFAALSRNTRRQSAVMRGRHPTCRRPMGMEHTALHAATSSSASPSSSRPNTSATRTGRTPVPAAAAAASGPTFAAVSSPVLADPAGFASLATAATVPAATAAAAASSCCDASCGPSAPGACASPAHWHGPAAAWLGSQGGVSVKAGGGVEGPAAGGCLISCWITGCCVRAGRS